MVIEVAIDLAIAILPTVDILFAGQEDSLLIIFSKKWHTLGC